MRKVSSWIIEYQLYGAAKSFIIRAGEMNNAQAWHWACCDAGVAPIPKVGKPPLKRMSKPMAERFGITNVLWRAPDTLVWNEVQK